MKTSIERKLQQLLERFEELGALLAEPAIIQQQDTFKTLSKEYAQLEPVVEAYHIYQKAKETVESLQQMSMERDVELSELAKEELPTALSTAQAALTSLEWTLTPKDPKDNANVYLEIRAGTGGDEAAIFAGDLFRMYSRYAELSHWHIEVVSANQGEHGGFKEVIALITGKHAYGHLKFESGTHRVQRVPLTESQGRVHTSACTVAILPEVEEIDNIDIRPDDLRIDTYRSSGAGGQHVNKTDSAIRITHIPTGVVVECQEERSQHKNRAKAMSLLATRLLDMEQSKQRKQQAESRKLQVGSGDRSERIRTYNYPQGRLTDHRINLTLYALTDILEGQLHPVIDALLKEHHTELLAELSQQ